MHELSIALSMIDAVEEELQAHGGASVRAVHMRLGVLSGVDAGALVSAFELAREGTLLEDARLEIEIVGLRVHCPSCKQEHTPHPQDITCPRCFTPPQQILAGREMEIRALELTDE